MLTLKPTPYKASVNSSLLKHLVFMGCFDDVAPDMIFDQLTDKDIKSYLKSFTQTKNRIYDSTFLKEAIINLNFPVNIRDSSAQITTYCADVFERFDAMGNEVFKTGNLKDTNKLLFELTKPSALKDAMFERIKVKAGMEK